jgi:catechol 2,3-dioxygenase-like lactoylglutathione lyase family enzyme
MTVKLLDHVNIHTADLAGTVDFYVDVIGLEQGARPTTLARPGAWLYCGGRPLIHLNENEQSRPGGTGPIDHVAFETEGYERVASKLTERGVTFQTKELPDFRIRQIFVHDPNGVKLELNFRES